MLLTGGQHFTLVSGAAATATRQSLCLVISTGVEGGDGRGTKHVCSGELPGDNWVTLSDHHSVHLFPHRAACLPPTWELLSPRLLCAAALQPRSHHGLPECLCLHLLGKPLMNEVTPSRPKPHGRAKQRAGCPTPDPVPAG